MNRTISANDNTLRSFVGFKDRSTTLPTSTTREAIVKWEHDTQRSAKDAEELMLNGFFPPIALMDDSLLKLINCQKLSLSTNQIERIANLNGLRNLRSLSLGRNLIKSLVPLEALSDSLEELWVSYNSVQKFDGLLTMKKLRVLYISHNLIKDWFEFRRLSSIFTLTELVFTGNPLELEWRGETSWSDSVQETLKSLRRLNGVFLQVDRLE